MAPATPSPSAGEPGGTGAKKPASASSSAAPAVPATKPPAESPPSPPARQIQEANPPLYYLKDKDGNLVPVPGYRLEDFEEMVQKRYRSAETDPTPRYTLQSLAATGAAKTDHVEMSFLFKFLVHEDGWVRIPLRLDQAVLRGQGQHRGPGSQFLHFEPGGEGYVVWTRSGSGKEHELTLDALVPVVRVGEDTRLRLALPRAAR